MKDTLLKANIEHLAELIKQERELDKAANEIYERRKNVNVQRGALEEFLRRAIGNSNNSNLLLQFERAIAITTNGSEESNQKPIEKPAPQLTLPKVVTNGDGGINKTHIILGAIQKHEVTGLKASDILTFLEGEKADISINYLHNILSKLRKRGLLMHDAVSKKYHLTAEGRAFKVQT